MTRRIFAGLVLSILFVFVLATTAFATQGDSTYLPAGGVNPHGGYQVSSKKCGVCHSVHHAGKNGDGMGSEALLRSDMANACTYCHIWPGVSSKIVYGGVQANYSGTDFNNAHNDTAVTCSGTGGCHQVHAAASLMTSNAALTSYILVKSTVGYDPDTDPANNGEPVSGDSTDTAITKWCTSCHANNPPSPSSYVPDPIENASHLLTSTVDGQHAFSGSAYCSSCHNSNTVGGSPTTGSAFPHYTDGKRFLTSALTSAGGSVNATAATDPSFDGVCLRCHRNGAGVGIGQTF